MRKILFASTALVAAGLMTAGSANAADKIKLNLGGFSKWWVVGTWQDDKFANATQVTTNGASGLPGKRQGADVKGDNEIWFTGETTLDNGLKVGVKVELEAGGHSDVTTDVIDQSFAWVESGFGKIELGTTASSAGKVHVQAPDAAGNWGNGGIMTGNFALSRPSGVLMTNQVSGYTSSASTTMITTDDNAEKISYYTPTFAGLQVGGSYIPNMLRQDARGTPLAGASAYTLGGLYSNSFGGVGLKISAAYLKSNLNNRSAGASGIDGWQQQAYGTQLSYAGFTLGGSYQIAKQNNSNGAGITSITQPGGAGFTFNNATGAGSAYNGVDFGGNSWDIGLQYASGPYAISFAYFQSSVNGLLANSSKDTIEFYQASGKYNLSAGIDLLASVGHAEYRDETYKTTTASNAQKNEGWTVMSGLSLSF